MSDGSTIMLKNGKDGESSAIDVRRSNDGILYWTLNGKYMYDADGNKIKAAGIDGVSGVTPQLRVNKDGYWEYSHDGANWLPIKDEDHRPVKASPDESDLGFNIEETNESIIITFKGKKYTISKTGGAGGETPETGATIAFTKASIEVKVGDKGKIEYTLNPATTDATGIVWKSSREDIVKVGPDGSYEALLAGNADITAMLGSSVAKLTITVTESSDPGALKKVDFKLTLVKNYATTAVVSATPPDNEMPYILLILQEEIYDQYGKERIHEDWIKKGWIDEQKENWKSLIPVFQYRGTKEEDIRGSGATVDPGAKYVAYVYGCDDDGNQTTEVQELRFTLRDITKVPGLTFDIRIKEYTPDGPIVEITPSDDSREYIVNILAKNSWESWAKDGTRELELIGIEIANFPSTFKTKGKTTYAPGFQYDSIKTKLKWKDYVLIVYGYDEENGVNTEFELRDIPKGGVAPTTTEK